jgi:hypothetical protein
MRRGMPKFMRMVPVGSSLRAASVRASELARCRSTGVCRHVIQRIQQ